MPHVYTSIHQFSEITFQYLSTCLRYIIVQLIRHGNESGRDPGFHCQICVKAASTNCSSFVFLTSTFYTSWEIIWTRFRNSFRACVKSASNKFAVSFVFWNKLSTRLGKSFEQDPRIHVRTCVKCACKTLAVALSC